MLSDTEEETAHNDGFIPDEPLESDDDCNCSDPQCGCDGPKRLTREFM